MLNDAVMRFSVVLNECKALFIKDVQSKENKRWMDGSAKNGKSE